MSEVPRVQVDFVGPFAWPDLPGAPTVFQAPEGRACGIYLWTVPTEKGHIAYYVGETGSSFSARLREHYKNHRAGFYHLNDPDQFRRGHKVEIWPGMWGSVPRKSKADCTVNLSRLQPFIDKLTSTYQFLLAPLDVDHRLRKRIEAALADVFSALPGELGTFQEDGIVYHRRVPSEFSVRCTVSARTVSVIGLPVDVMV